MSFFSVGGVGSSYFGGGINVVLIVWEVGLKIILIVGVKREGGQKIYRLATPHNH